MSRKESAWVRLIAWSITAAALFVILMLGLTGHFHWINIGFNNSFIYAESGKYQAGPGEISGNQVDELDINWIDGNIKIQVYDGSTVQFSEKSSKKLKESERLHYYNKNGRLIIQYQKAQRNLLSFGGSKNKELTIMLPEKTAEKMKYVGVDTVSGDTQMTGIRAEQIELDSTSGDFELTDCKSKKLEMDSTSGTLTGRSLEASEKLETDTTSGSVKVEGRFAGIDSDTVSGDVEVESSICPDKVTTDSTSGSVLLIIPDNDGFEYKRDSVSGSFKCDFEVSQDEDRGEYKNGRASFRFDSVSGSVTIRKK